MIGIADEDTFSCLTAYGDQVRVRLAGINAPELGQPYSRRARQALSGFVFGKDVTLIVQDRDRYGRTVAQVKVADLDVNAELVGTGAAWAYRAYLTNRLETAIYIIELATNFHTTSTLGTHFRTCQITLG